MKKNLTLRYGIQRVLYWAGMGGVASFGVSYLTAMGFTAAQVGWILFGAYIFSFVVQPLVAEKVDKAEGCVIPGILLGFSCLSILCFALTTCLKPDPLVFALLYLCGVLCMDVQIPLMNSLYLLYDRTGVRINYGLSLGIGGVGFAVATLGYGHLMEYAGADKMPLVAMTMIMIYALVSITYPGKPSKKNLIRENEDKEPCTLREFFVRYKWYSLSLFGVLMIAAAHIMQENYLIEIFKRIGGDNTNVGVALAIATVTELPAMTLFPFAHKKLGTKRVLIIAAIAYTIKSILFIIATVPMAIYFTQLLQCVTYVFVSAVSVFYAEESTEARDMIKGQSVITASYTLGSALGFLLGGVIIDAGGVLTMMYAALGAVILGLLTFVIVLPRALGEKTK